MSRSLILSVTAQLEILSLSILLEQLVPGIHLRLLSTIVRRVSQTMRVPAELDTLREPVRG
ncbi:hypothetical protein D3D01_19805 [Haloarcula sp. Atlit-7R]|nr:hypothetical protein D3D01_19805 [Haloarcula sp. Atlit-7R]